MCVCMCVLGVGVQDQLAGDLSSNVHVGDRVSVRVVEVNPVDGRFFLSMREAPGG